MTQANENIRDFLSCSVRYENVVLGKSLDQAAVAADAVNQKFMPQLSSTVETGQDLLSGNDKNKNTNWSVFLSQNIYSRTNSTLMNTQNMNIKAQEELIKAQLLFQTTEKSETILEYISTIEDRNAIKNQIERQESLLKLLDALVKARLSDAGQMLIARSDLLLIKTRLLSKEAQLHDFEEKLKVYPFFSEKFFSSAISRKNFFNFVDSLAPLEIDSRPELLALKYQYQVANHSLKSQESAWQPSLAASLAYNQALANPENLTNTKEALVGLTLTFPIDEFFKTAVSESYERAEMNRVLISKERLRNVLVQENSSDEALLRTTNQSMQLLQESKKNLSMARQVLMKKFELNRISYFEISSLDEKIDSIDNALVEKQIAIWRIYAKWTLQRLISVFQPKNENLKCQ